MMFFYYLLSCVHSLGWQKHIPGLISVGVLSGQGQWQGKELVPGGMGQA